jgi:acetylornithine/succinyldiaminopimelate/putrescine aminotransferase
MEVDLFYDISAVRTRYHIADRILHMHRLSSPLLALNKGLLLGHGGVKGNTVRIQPPLVITEEQLEKTVQVFDECLRETH